MKTITKEIMVIGILIVLLIPIVLAFEFDNVKDFEKGELEYGKATITNFFGLGDKLAEITLLDNTDHCFVNCYAEGETILFKDGKLLDSMRFKKLNGNYKTIDYKFYVKDKGKWIEYDNSKLTPGTYEWRIEGIKNPLESIDWLGTFLGVEVDEWALWGTASDNNAYWGFNTPSNTTAIDDVGGLYNGTFGSNMNATDFQTGIIDTGMHFNGSQIYTVPNGFVFEDTFSVSFWINPSNLGATKFFFENFGGLDKNWQIQNHITGYNLSLVGASNDNLLETPQGNWTHIVGVYNGTDLLLYRNGTNVKNHSIVFTFDGDASTFGGSTGGFFNGTLDEIGTWNRTLSVNEIIDLYNDGSALAFGSFSVGLDSPSTNTLINNDSQIFNASYFGTDLFNATYYFYNNSGIFNNTITINITGSTSNSSSETLYNITAGNYSWNVLACNSTGGVGCVFALDNFTFKVEASISSVNYSYQAYETENIIYQINFTSLPSITPTNPIVNYNGTEFVGTLTNIIGDDYTLDFSHEINNSIVGVNNTLFFKWNLENYIQQTGNFTQLVNGTSFGLCNATLTTQYANYTFQDETDLAFLNATFLTAWQYYLSTGSGKTNNTLAFQDTTENQNYSFCLNPPDRTLNVIGTTQYSASTHPQRRNDFSLIFTNTTSKVILFLLSSSDGIFAQFQIADNINGTPLAGVDVTVQRTISSVLTTIATDVSDDAGVAIFFLNPDFMHTFTFIKTGWESLVQNIQPTSADVYTVLMQSTTVTTPSGFNATNIADGLNYTINPTLAFLNNNTNYTFGIFINSTQSLTATMLLENATAAIAGNTTSGTSFTLTSRNDTFGYSRIKGTFTISNANETIIFTRVWSIENFETGDYSLWAFLTEWTTQGGGQAIFDWIRILVIFSTLIATFFLLHTQTGSDTFDSSTIPIFGAIIVLWIFSIAGWLNVAFFPDTFAGAYQGWLNKHGIATLITILGGGFLGWRFTTQG